LTREPTKATYARFESHPDEEFDYYLCLKLGWRSVEQMRRGMSGREWNRWRLYFARRAQERELREARRG
jgi:hypothetical protein